MDNIYDTKITVSVFDEAALEEGCSPTTKINKYTLSNGWMEVDIIDFGATITSIRTPDRDGNIADIALGYDNIKGYLATSNNPYFGATIGRFANRIAGGKFILDDVLYILSRNEGDKTLHGGVVGFNRKLWSGCVDNEGLVLQIVSPHLDMGFPGELVVKAKFVLTKMNTLIITYSANSDRPTAINMTNHSYFNLAGHDTGSEKLYEHNLMINATNFLPNDDNMIPKGKLQDVIDTVLDFNTSKSIGDAIAKTGDSNGFDMNFCVNGPTFRKKLMASLEHPGTGRRMMIYSNQPGIQLYTANCVQVKEGRGKGGATYSKHCGLCLETQNYPNAVNVKNFPSCILRPPDEYVHVIAYEFTTFEAPPPPVVTPSDSDSKSFTDYLNEPSASDYRRYSLETTSQKSGVEKTTEPTECNTDKADVYPNFTIATETVNTLLEYEPYSEIKPYPECKDDDFHTVLKQCQDLCSRSDSRLPTLICTKTRHDSILNVLTDTDLTQSRIKF